MNDDNVYFDHIDIADWCNSNIIGSCPIVIGANPLSAQYILSIFKVIA